MFLLREQLLSPLGFSPFSIVHHALCFSKEARNAYAMVWRLFYAYTYSISFCPKPLSLTWGNTFRKLTKVNLLYPKTSPQYASVPGVDQELIHLLVLGSLLRSIALSRGRDGVMLTGFTS